MKPAETRPTSARSALLALCVLVLPLLGAVGCSTPPPVKAVTVSERVQFDRAIGTELSRQLEPELKLKKDSVVSGYLRGIGQGMADAAPDMHLPSVDVKLVENTDGRWQSFGLPGGTLYLATGLLKTLGFENEVAGLLAIELGHIRREHVLDHLRKSHPELAASDLLAPGQQRIALAQIQYLGPGGLFDFKYPQEEEAAGVAVDLMYGAGYDPRGLVTVWEKFQANPSRSPYSPAELEKLLDATRRVIALHSPLRNPIVRTQAFVAIRRHLQKF